MTLMSSIKIYLKKYSFFIVVFLSINLTFSQSDPLNLTVNNNKKISLLYNLASYNIRGYQNYETGIPLCQKLLAELQKEGVTESVEYARALVLYCQGLVIKGEFDKALEHGLMAREIFDKNHNKHHRDQAAILNEITYIYYIVKGNINKAISYCLESVKVCENTPIPDKELYSATLNTLASIYDDIGQIEKALNYYKKALTIVNQGESEILTKGVILNNLSFINRRIGNYDVAAKYANEALLFVENIQGKDHSHFGGTLNNLAITYELSKDYDKASTYYLKALDNIEKSIGKNTFDYLRISYNLAQLNEKMGSTKKALSQYIEIKEKTSHLFGDENILYNNIATSLSNLYNASKEYKKSLSLLIEKDQITHKLIKTNFVYQTAKEKKSFIINTIGTEGLNHFANFNYLNNNSYDEAIPLALNNILTSKGLILNATRDLIIDLKGLNNKALNDSIDRFIKQRKFITKQLQLPIPERADSLNQIKEKNNNLERILVNAYSKHFNSDINYVKDYKNTNLKSKDIAIEFTHFELYNKKWTDSIMYVAYLYKKGWKTPKVVNLFEEQELKDYFEKYSSRGSIAITKQKNDKVAISELLYELIWQPLEPHLDDVETIYYSPDGLLHKVPINALPTNEGRFLGEVYNLNRVSNTAYINTEKKLPNLDDSLLIGDIIYEYAKKNDSLVNEAANHNIINSKNLLKNEENKNRNTRSGSWDYLPGTKVEIDFIKSVLTKSKILRQKEATETAYKELSGSSPSILHISTHGFFFPDLEEEENNSSYVLAEDPMLRSGLILANANYAWRNGSNPYEEDDGILTALDISNLDLRNTDIVILSACETGLGDIPSSEGVFGLQRAFKMAGVNTIIMTLWEVPDKETAEFMTMFYKKWKTLNNPKEAFKHAQNYMMKRYRYQPDKWAAFVLFE